MRFISRKYLLVLISVVCLGWLTPRLLYAEAEGTAFGVALYDGDHPLDGRCCHGCNDLDPYYVQLWIDYYIWHLDDYGYDQLRTNLDKTVDGIDFLDNHLFASGNDDSDPYGTDFADSILYIGHGGNTCTSTEQYSTFTMGSSGFSYCTIQTADVTTGVNGHIKWGNGGANEEADVFITASCHGAQKCVFNGNGYLGQMSYSSGQYNIYLGFHGNNDIGLSQAWKFNNYLTGTRDNHIGDDWLTMYTPNGHGTYGTDICPVAMVIGANHSERQDSYIYSGFMDFHNTGARTATEAWGVAGCTPHNGEPW